MSLPVNILIDGRETKLIAELTTLGADFESKELINGDIIFKRDEDTLLMCERKTYADLASSIADGRYAQQREAMKESGAKIMYIIEGPNRPRTDLDAKRVLGALENLALVHGICVLPTVSVAETALAVQHLKKKLEGTAVRTGNEIVVPKIVRRKGKIMENVMLHQLQVITGVSADVARAIVAIYPTMRALIAAYDSYSEQERGKMLADVMLTKRRIGPAVSQRIYSALFIEGI